MVIIIISFRSSLFPCSVYVLLSRVFNNRFQEWWSVAARAGGTPLGFGAGWGNPGAGMDYSGGSGVALPQRHQ
jgi:hypothetical protein